MTQLFPEPSNTLGRVLLVGTISGALALVAALILFQWSSYNTTEGYYARQPVPFSHEHHVNTAKIDCRFCHTSVETSSSAGIPPMSTCMNCHSWLYRESPFLAPVRESFRSGVPLKWQRIYDLPDFVFFNHSIHVAKGVGCATCHGRVDLMPLMTRAVDLHMRWCINCHRNPAPHLRPRDQIFNMAWEPPADQPELGQKLLRDYNVQTKHLLDCVTCHR